MSEGWISLHRKFFNHFLWDENREYSKAEAWIDLIYQARWKATEKSMMHNGQVVKWSRGQLVASVRFLRNRWGWKSNTKVSTFLELLEKEDMIRYEKKTAIGRITICKYDDYQFSEDAFKDTHKTGKGQGEDKHKTKQKQREQGNKDNNYIQFVDFWNEVNDCQLRMTDKKRDQIKARLNTFTGEEIRQSIRNRSQDEWINGEGAKFKTDWNSFWRNDEKVERYLESRDNGQSYDNHPLRYAN